MSCFVYDAVRTPFGRYGKGLAHVRPDDMLASVLSQILARNPNLDPTQVDDVIIGNANGAGEENRNVARMSWLLAGLPDTVPGVTVNRLCGSSMEAVIQGARAIETNDYNIVVTGGVESMSRAPWVMSKPERAFPATGAQLESTSIGWRLVNPKMPQEHTVALGEGAEILADRYNISRQEQDEFACRSQTLAATSWDAGAFDAEIVQIPEHEMERDEAIRATSMEALEKLRPAFRKDGGSVTAGNSSPLSDGASTLILGNEAAEKVLGSPLARVVSRGASALAPGLFGLGPVEASNEALKKCGLTWNDVDIVEMNEAFAAQSLACLQQWPDLDPAKVNVNGGAIAIGHPLGASGGRVVGHLAHLLNQRGGGVGVATLCIGVGQGLAVVLKA